MENHITEVSDEAFPMLGDHEAEVEMDNAGRTY